MMRTLLSACAALLLTAGLAMAQPGHGHVVHPTHHAPPPNHKFVPGKPVHRPAHVRPVAPVHHKHWVGRNYHLRYGRHFRYGYWYYGYRHNHWSRYYWDNRYGAYLYYDPYALSWYYWCAPHFAFYPVTYVPLGTYSFPYVADPQPPATAPPLPPDDAGPAPPPVLPPAPPDDK